MIRVTIELISAITGKTEKIGMMDICNRGDRTNLMCQHNYDFRIYKRGSWNYRAGLKVQEQGEVLDYSCEAYSVWCLVLRALYKIWPEQVPMRKPKQQKPAGGEGKSSAGAVGE